MIAFIMPGPSQLLILAVVVGVPIACVVALVVFLTRGRKP